VATDDEVKFGLAVTGRVNPRRLLTNATAAVGDRLVLTKPLGTGLLATAAKAGTLGSHEAESLYASMRALNGAASRAAVDVGARCATDVTGFGLLGHALHIAVASGVSLIIESARVPLLPGAEAAWARGVRTGGGGRNETHLQERVAWGDSSAAHRALFIDPQTSGGLLVAVPEARLADYLSRVPGAVEIGRVAARGDRELVLV
jgi:selenide,water dikinase